MVQNKAVVKSVLSGDTVILRGKPKANGPPAERLLALNNVQAPRLGNKDKEDEPFAFASREFLRKTLVGKEVIFVPEYTVGTGNPPREYGTIQLQDGTDVAQLGIKEGWLKVREGGKRGDAEGEDKLENLRNLEEEARSSAKGIWGDKQKGQRTVKHNLTEDSKAFLNKYKGKQLDAIIEQVRDASTFRVLVMANPQEHQMLSLQLSGVKAPVVRRDIPDQPDVVEPYGEEAKYFVESRLLQRGVKVILEGVAQAGNPTFVGSVIHPAGNIAEALLSQGLAKCVDWSITLVTGGPTKLRNAERVAKEQKLRLWKDFVTKEKTSESEFDAVVVKVVTGDTIIVRNTKSGQEKKVQFSSIKQAPRGAGSSVPGAGSKSKDVKEVGYQFEAREYLRKRLIGKQVHVIIDYVKPAQDGFEEKECATIKVSDSNIAQQLVERGLASVIRHRKDDENRSQAYDQLMIAETKAQEAQKGIHSTKEQPIVRITDASENTTKARQFLTFLKRTGRVAGVVDHVANASRLFIWIPKENCRLTFVLAGVRAPRVARSAGEKSEPFAEEGARYVSNKVLQRDIEIEVENVDKTGGFVGSLFVNGENLSVSLLQAGYAYIHEYSANESNYANQLFSAERIAKGNKKGVWAQYDEEAEKEATQEKEQAVSATPNREYIDIIVSEVIDGGRFYVQVLNDQAKKLETLMSEFADHHSKHTEPSVPKPRNGELVSAKFTEDDSWYRAKVRKANAKGVEVFYVDYGNSETVPLSRIRALPQKFSTLPHQAQEATLSFVKAPSKDEDYGVEALERLQQLAAGKQLVANVDSRDGGALSLTLFDPAHSTSADASINYDVVRDGFGHVIAKTRYAGGNQDIIKSLQDALADAKRERLGMFEFGDNTPSDD
ncbi:hypothetical protein INT43_004023 [Umbelopsis isabellina]|uniref:Transcription factor n=1 Tax=Mortierella isabellina TaxID=91625 RepID=A0A8H7UIF0_MORIS|nr:hypothetical protein INT43_004023 [Umbelopsis isabellina]